MYEKEIQSLKAAMQKIANQVCMANPDYRDLKGRLETYQDLQLEEQMKEEEKKKNDDSKSEDP